MDLPTFWLTFILTSAIFAISHWFYERLQELLGLKSRYIYEVRQRLVHENEKERMNNGKVNDNDDIKESLLSN